LKISVTGNGYFLYVIALYMGWGYSV